jgi:hypothetical protein
MDLDRRLIAQAQHFINGQNVHDVTTWLLCYERSSFGSPRRQRYENLLRDFVRTQVHLRAIRSNAEYLRTHSNEILQMKRAS